MRLKKYGRTISHFLSLGVTLCLTQWLTLIGASALNFYVSQTPNIEFFFLDKSKSKENHKM